MRRPKRGKSKRKGVVGALLVALAACALLGLAAAGFVLRPPPTDPETLCRTDAPIAAHTMVLVDSTDRFERRHRRKLEAVLAQERARLSHYDRLSIVRVNPRRPQEPTRLFSRCLPQPPEQTNPLFQNARRARERWEADFGDVLKNAARSASAGRGASASPIVASLRAVAADPDFGPEIPNRRLVLVSDLLEHDPEGFSLYVSGADYASWDAQTVSPPPDLSGVDVRVSPLDRPESTARQGEALASFWPAFFDAAQSKTVSIDPAP